MDVSERTLRAWENGRTPSVSHYPLIIKFLGREPWPEPEGLPQQLRAARRRRGTRIEEAAPMLGVDASTLWWWEKGRKPHRREHRTRIAEFIGGKGPDRPSDVAVPIHSEPNALPDLAAWLRDRRHELGLNLSAAAEQIGVNEWTLMHWENEHHAPMDRFYPALIRFLGREPWPEPKTLGEQLRAERLRRGLSQKQAAAILEVDPQSVRDWEAGKSPRHRLSGEKVQAFVTGTVRPWARSKRSR